MMSTIESSRVPTASISLRSGRDSMMGLILPPDLLPATITGEPGDFQQSFDHDSDCADLENIAPLHPNIISTDSSGPGRRARQQVRRSGDNNGVLMSIESGSIRGGERSRAISIVKGSRQSAIDDARRRGTAVTTNLNSQSTGLSNQSREPMNASSQDRALIASARSTESTLSSPKREGGIVTMKTKTVTRNIEDIETMLHKVCNLYLSQIDWLRLIKCDVV